MDDIEAMASLDGLSREQLRFYPEEHGGSVAGKMVVIDRDPETGAEVRIDCQGFGTGSYSIPHSVEHLKFETDAKFVLAIETGGMFQRLNNHKYWHSAQCILIETAGVPTRATRRFIRILSDQHKLPVYAFVDCDPYSIARSAITVTKPEARSRAGKARRRRVLAEEYSEEAQQWIPGAPQAQRGGPADRRAGKTQHERGPRIRHRNCGTGH